MKFLVDECTGASVANFLCAEGYDAIAAAEIMPEANDKEILDRAVSENRIVVTNDKDFGELVYRNGWKHRSILLLRLRDERAKSKVQMIQAVLAELGEQLQDRYVVATENGIRVRKVE